MFDWFFSVPEDQRNFIDSIVGRVETWIRDEPNRTLHLEKCNPFQRKLIYQTLKTKFGQELFMETVDKDKDKVIAVSKVKQGLRGIYAKNENPVAQHGTTRLEKILSLSCNVERQHFHFLCK
jgi:hypothetical protein